MEIIISNKTKEEIYLKIEKSEEKITILPESQHKLEGKDKKSVEVVIIYKSDEKVENKYEIKIPSNVTVESDGIYEIVEDKKNKLEKLNVEGPKKIQTIHKQKTFHHSFDEFKKDQFLFLGNDKTIVYKFKELKYSEDSKIEAILINNESLEEKIVDCLKEKMTSLVKLRLNIIHPEDVMFQKYILIDVNEKIKSIYKIIEERAENFNIGKDFRLVYKNQDISAKLINKKVFSQVNEGNMENLNEGQNEEKINSETNFDISQDEQSNENLAVDIEDEMNDEDYELEDQKLSENLEDSENNSKNKNCKKECILEESKAQDNIENSNQKNCKSEAEKCVEVSTTVHNPNNDINHIKKPAGKLTEKTLIDFNFSFQNDYLCIIPPEAPLRIFSLKSSQDSVSNNYKNGEEIPNIFIFSKNVILKNFYISWYNYGNRCRGRPPDYDFTVYEMDIDPMEKEKLSENSDEKEGETFKYENLHSVWEKKKGSSFRVIFEKKKIKLENCEENTDFKEAIDSGFFIPTNEIKISKNKIYTFLFKFGSNQSYYDYSYLEAGESAIFKTKECEDLIIYGASKNSCYHLLGFNYKINITA